MPTLIKLRRAQGGREFAPVTISCCRTLLAEPLNKLLDKMRELSGADEKEKLYGNP